MNQFTMILANETQKVSKLSHGVRLGLGISLGVVFGLALIVLVLTFVFRKKLLKKVLNPNEAKEIEKLKTSNPNYGIVLDGIKSFYQNKADDFFVAFLSNTIYLNKYQTVLIEDENDYVALSLSNLTEAKINIVETIKLDKQREAIEKSDLSFKFDDERIIYLAKRPDINLKYDLILALDPQKSITQNIAHYYGNMSDNAILVVAYNNLKQLKLEKIAITSRNLRYETIKYKHKNVILLAKDPIKEKVEQ